MPGIYLVRCGPGSQPYVRTKFDVKGELLLPAENSEKTCCSTALTNDEKSDKPRLHQNTGIFCS